VAELTPRREFNQALPAPSWLRNPLLPLASNDLFFGGVAKPTTSRYAGVAAVVVAV
jgi:hypothetical protein